MPLPQETITPLIVKAVAERSANESAKMAQREAKRADKSRVDALQKEMERINTQIKVDGRLQEGLQLFIQKNRIREIFRTYKETFIGLPIAQTYSRAVVLTPVGIKIFAINSQNHLTSDDPILDFSAFDITRDADIGELLPPKDFPSPEILSLKITKLLGN